jgi:hypothetical protein
MKTTFTNMAVSNFLWELLLHPQWHILTKHNLCNFFDGSSFLNSFFIFIIIIILKRKKKTLISFSSYCNHDIDR